MQFRIYQPLPGRTLTQELDDLLLQLYDVKTNFTRVYFSDVKNQLPVFERHPLAKKLNERVMAYVEQPPLDGSKVALQTVEGDASHFLFKSMVNLQKNRHLRPLNRIFLSLKNKT